MRTLAHQGVDEPFQKVLAQDFLNDALDLTAERVKNHGIALRVQAPSESLSIDCRRHEILQILVNLINNAFDAVQTLSEKWISVEFTEEEEWLRIKVKDSGGGIPEATSQHIFEPFFSTKKVQYGTGLGLAISRSLAAKHRGTLELDRTDAHTCFCLLLPKQHLES
jgi:two-component system CheB/CheR fusion protein